MKLEQYIKKGSFYEAVVEDGSDIIFIVDFDGLIHYHNSSVYETLGYRAKTLIGKNFFDFILPETRSELKSKFTLSQKRAYTEKVEFQFLCKDRSYRFLEFNAINLKHKDKVNGFILDCRDIMQRKRDAEELVRLQKAKEQFLANISHEIRTPINGIAGMANLLGQSPTAEESETYLNAIRHSAENLKVIINDLLDLAAIDSGKLRFERIPFNIKDLLPSLISTFTYQARDKRIALEYSIDERLNKIVLGDPVRLNQILINLISNAVKFTHNGSITVDCTIDRQQKNTCWIRVEVRDTGVGIPAEKLNTIFESFSQADASVTRKYGGSGLGLTIVKQLVEMQNGKITVRSEEHVGSTFIVLIPYGIGKTRALGIDTDRKNKSLPDFNLQNLRVLLVEDNDINRLYAKSILKNWRCQTDTAENGLVALEKLKNDQFDVVLMDVQMPVMDGYEATKAIRSMAPPVNKIPIVALTANATKADVEKCIAAGMNDYLPKPFTPDDLHRKLFEELKVTPGVRAPGKKGSGARKSYFDFSYLRSVSGNNQEFIREMILTFSQSVPEILGGMRNSLDTKDWAKLSRLAHQVKPSFTLLGLDSMRVTLVSIEEQGKSRDNLEELTRVTKRFLAKCDEIIPHLKDELNEV